MALLSVDDARARILSHFQAVTTETLPLVDCNHRVLAQDVAATTDLPPFDNSSMDGFAIRVADINANSSQRLHVIADIPAGVSPTISLSQGEAARIMTGAQVPAGADAVVPVEDTDFNNRDAGSAPPEWVAINTPVNKGANIRARGMDLHAGEIVLYKGRALKPQDLGLLAMLGYADVPVHTKARVALFSSGNELLEVGAPLEPGKIRDSNSYTLEALLKEAGAHVIRLGVARDDRESVKALLDKAVESGVDLILSSAGVSVGAFDFVKEVIEANGKLDFWRVNMRPGKPLAFGEYKNIPFIGLPGNPVSAFVGFEVFVRDVIGKLNGIYNGSRLKIQVRCAEQVDSDGRESYLRAEVREENGNFVAYLTGHQGSGNLHSLVRANALLIIPAGVKCVPAGQEVNAWLI